MHLFRQRRPVERENPNGNPNAATREGDDVERQSSLLLPSAEDDLERSYAARERSRERLSMAVNHLTAFVLIFYGLYATCRFGLGWDPIRDPPPPTFTVEVPGLTSGVETNDPVFLDISPIMI